MSSWGFCWEIAAQLQASLYHIDYNHHSPHAPNPPPLPSSPSSLCPNTAPEYCLNHMFYINQIISQGRWCQRGTDVTSVSGDVICLHCICRLKKSKRRKRTWGCSESSTADHPAEHLSCFPMKKGLEFSIESSQSESLSFFTQLLHLSFFIWMFIS